MHSRGRTRSSTIFIQVTFETPCFCSDQQRLAQVARLRIESHASNGVGRVRLPEEVPVTHNCVPLRGFTRRFFCAARSRSYSLRMSGTRMSVDHEAWSWGPSVGRDSSPASPASGLSGRSRRPEACPQGTSWAGSSLCPRRQKKARQNVSGGSPVRPRVERDGPRTEQYHPQSPGWGAVHALDGARGRVDHRPQVLGPKGVVAPPFPDTACGLRCVPRFGSPQISHRDMWGRTPPGLAGSGKPPSSGLRSRRENWASRFGWGSEFPGRAFGSRSAPSAQSGAAVMRTRI